MEGESSEPCYNDTPGRVTICCLKKLISEKNIQLFDVRSREEIMQSGEIPMAVNIPLSDIASAFSLTPEKFEQTYRVPMPKKTDNNIVIHCRSGRRAERAMEILREHGFTGTHNFTGGWTEWQEAMKKSAEMALSTVS
ncbi:thiosulfate:glutathione sulfurtransferase [Nematostella vectensis]|uniref:thiosulfate:glutathione sulfurtransferase n=1 Tax=Nematostella vectensis TaxID=45351 RepID=UPI00139035BC|nr:thiosulfate:glutathione sulfurtransferase [Nematostella vectensis]